MEGDSDEAKISYFHHWIDTTGQAQVKAWINKGILVKKDDFDKLSEDEKKASTLKWI